jgi:hypothetical protein
MDAGRTAKVKAKAKAKTVALIDFSVEKRAFIFTYCVVYSLLSSSAVCEYWRIPSNELLS